MQTILISILSAALLMGSMMAAPAGDVVHPNQIPGYPTDSTATMYSGVLKSLNDIHYVLVKSKSDYREDPIILFVPSTPGCTVLESLFYENGPIRFHHDGSMTTNHYSWHDRASLLYLDAIAGVGYSEGSEPALDDTSAVIELRGALTLFFERFPELRNNRFYLASRKNGAGIITELAHDIHVSKDEVRPTDRINLQGLIYGNPVMGEDAETKFVQTDALAAHGFLEKSLVMTYREECLADPSSATCVELQGKVTRLLDQVNKFNFLKPCDIDQTDGKCLSITHDAFTKFLASQQVRDAFHVSHIVKPIKVCESALETKYLRQPDKNPLFSTLAGSGDYDILVYSGDSDLIVPTLATQSWLGHLFSNSLTDHPVREPTRQWSLINVNPKLQGEAAGTVTLYGAGINFVTIRGAGHFAGQDKPERVNYVVNQFLTGSRLR